LAPRLPVVHIDHRTISHGIRWAVSRIGLRPARPAA
jgi:hypothetical protein